MNNKIKDGEQWIIKVGSNGNIILQKKLPSVNNVIKLR